MKVIKKDGTIEQFDGQKIVNAVSKSAARAMIELDDTQYHEIVSKVMAIVTERFPEQVHVADMHNIVEQVLDEVNPFVFWVIRRTQTRTLPWLPRSVV